MRERNITISGFPFINFLKMSAFATVNEHVKFFIQGHLPPDHTMDIIRTKHVGDDVTVTVVDDQGNSLIIFWGMISSLKIEVVNELQCLSLELISMTYNSDVIPRTRTFQDSSMTYEEVADIIEEDSGKVTILVPYSRTRPIGEMFVQYEVTDWEAAKQLAARMNTCVVPHYRMYESYFCIGIPQSRKEIKLTKVAYSIKKDVGEYLRHSADNPEYTEREAISYEIVSRDIYQLCDEIMLNDIPVPLYVYSIKSELIGAVLVHTYVLKEKEGFSTLGQYNHKLIGASLLGNVIEIERDLVRVEILDDVKQKEHRWFSYSTPYSSSDETGWYFMPEIGDRIRLHFPNECEEESYVISCVHMGNRAQADVKSIITRHQKQVIFNPDSIYISNGAGSHIELHDENGITISSDKTISVQSEDDITIQGQSQIFVMGDDGVTIRQGDNLIQVDDVIDVTAGHVRMR